jgi:molybdenum cofactor synthesis domain-containing protein
MGHGGELPRLGAGQAERRRDVPGPAAHHRLFRKRLGIGRPAVRTGPRRRHPQRRDLEEEVAQLGGICRLGAERALEPGMDVFQVGQGRAFEVRGAALRQLPLPGDGVKELARARDELEKPIELREPAAVDFRHVRSTVADDFADVARPMVPGDGGCGWPAEQRAGVEYAQRMADLPSVERRLARAQILSIGSELLAGETRDTNAGELARALTGRGVRVDRIQALPDDLPAVAGAFRAALAEADVVVSTGGLGPTPDDLTREAIAELCGERPAVDPGIERWLRGLWARREMPFPEMNLKQAWLIPSATPIPNSNGTAPGWWVDRPDGRVVVALPGPPREMRPMWSDWVLPRLEERGLGTEIEIRTLRLTGIGESQVADLLGEALLRAPNPTVATYARSDAVDVRISAVAEPSEDGRPSRTAAEVAGAAESEVMARLRDNVWARGETSWSAAIGERLEVLGWRLATVELGTGGSLGALLGDAAWLRRTESLTADTIDDSAELERLAERAREAAGCEVGVAVRARPRGEDTAVSVVVASPLGSHHERRLAFLGGAQGRSRAALAAAGVLLAELGRAMDAPATEATDAAPTSAVEEVPR